MERVGIAGDETLPVFVLSLALLPDVTQALADPRMDDVFDRFDGPGGQDAKAALFIVKTIITDHYEAASEQVGAMLA